MQALEIISYMLAENTVINPIRLVTELRNGHNAEESSAGIDVRCGAVMDMWEEHVLQPNLIIEIK